MSVTVIDGGFGTLLARMIGSSAKVDCDPLWSARFLFDNPELVVRAHMEYAKAGAQLLRTNSYQASVEGFKKHLGVDEDEAIKTIKRSVELVRKAVNEYMLEQLEKDEIFMPPLIVGSVGPYGACLHDGSEYRGEYGSTMTQEELMAWHKPRIQALSEAGVRLLAVETIPALLEAKAVIKLLKKEFPHLRAWISFTCKVWDPWPVFPHPPLWDSLGREDKTVLVVDPRGRDGFVALDNQHISEGVKFSSAAAECWKDGCEQLEAVGVNCVNPEWVTALLSSAHTLTPSLPLIAYPNSGEIWTTNVGWHKTSELKPVSSYVNEWLKLGVRYIGGCCRTYPEDTKMIFKEVQRLTTQRQ